MAKKNVSARVPPQIADGVDEYADQWNLNRTDALTVLLKVALEEAPNPREVDVGAEVEAPDRTYTLELSPENAELIESADSEPEEAIQNALDNHRRLYGGPE